MGEGFKDFEKLLNGGVATKYKRKETKLGLSLNTSLTSLKLTLVFLVYCGATYSNETSRVYDILMNCFVIPREIQEINNRGSK